MDSNKPTPEVSTVNEEPAQLSFEFVPPESSTDRNLSDDNGNTTIYIINVIPSTLGTGMSFVAPLSPSSPSSSDYSMPTTVLTPASPSPKSSHVPLTPPATPPAQADSTSISSATNRKRKYSNQENSPPSSSKRIFKYQVNLDDVSPENMTEEYFKSINKAKSCKDQRDKKAAYVAQLKSDIAQLTQAKTELLAEINTLREELQVERSNSNDKDQVISELKAKIAEFDNQNNGQIDALIFDYLEGIDLSEF